LCPDEIKDFHNINLTQNTTAECIDNIANNMRIQLCNISKHSEVFSIAVDESTGINDVAQLEAFISEYGKRSTFCRRSETPVFFNMPGNITVQQEGSSTVLGTLSLYYNAETFHFKYMNMIPISGPNLEVTPKTTPSKNSLHKFCTPFLMRKLAKRCEKYASKCHIQRNYYLKCVTEIARESYDKSEINIFN
jgi:hypothetical protein